MTDHSNTRRRLSTLLPLSICNTHRKTATRLTRRALVYGKFCVCHSSCTSLSLTRSMRRPDLASLCATRDVNAIRLEDIVG